jgi:proteic killer suppression protein
MIKTIRHKGLKRLYQGDDPSAVTPSMSPSCATFWRGLMPAAALQIWIYRVPASPAKGRTEGFHAVTVRFNWGMIFGSEDGHAEDIDYVNYH